MSPDQVTLFIPIKHYHEDFLRQSIESVFRQTRSDWRLLFLVYEEHAEHLREQLIEPLKDPRVRLVVRRGPRLAGAYNSAMRAAETEFIAPVFADDMLAEDAVAVLGEHIAANPRIDFFHSGRYFIDADSQRISSDVFPTRPVTTKSFVTGSPVKHLMCWRVKTGLACGGVDETLENFASDDWDFPWTMMDHGAAFEAIPRALYVFRDHREAYRLTTHVPRSVQRRTLQRILTKHGVSRVKAWWLSWEAQRKFMRQSHFVNPAHRWLKERVGYDSRRGWREPLP
jgi:hypothetical protein